MEDELKRISKDAPHSLIEVASQYFSAGTEDNHERDLNTVHPGYIPGAVPVFQLIRYESKIT
jgi:hypothetical protein